MNSINSKKINLKNIILGTVAGSMLVAGTYALDARYDLLDKTKTQAGKMYDSVVGVFTTDIDEAREKLIEKIEENQQLGKEYDIKGLVNEINSYRNQRDVMDDAIEQIDNSQTYSKDIGTLLKKADFEQKNDITNNYLSMLSEEDGSLSVSAYKISDKLEGKSLNQIANKTYESLGDDEKKEFLDEKINQMPEPTQLQFVDSVSKTFSQETYEFLVPFLYERSVEKYDNRFKLTKTLFIREKEILGDFLKRVYNVGSNLFQEGKKTIEEYNSEKQ